MTSYIYVHILSLLKRCFTVNTSRNNFTQSPGVEIFRKQTVSANPWVIHPKICGNCPHTRKSEEILVLHTVEGIFALIYLCLLFRAHWNLAISYISIDSLTILLSSQIAKNSIILKFSPPHMLIRPSTSICCNSGYRISCLQVFNFSLSIVCAFPIYSSFQPLQIAT